MNTKIVVAEIAERLQKLEKRVKRDEKKGMDGKEHVKRQPSPYNHFVAENIHKMKGKTPQERLTECARLYHEEKGKKKRTAKATKSEGKQRKEEHKTQRKGEQQPRKAEEEESEDEEYLD